tara:strand:+ start:4352 stop:4552 length:201 start_codon:yes stop_codon:yes gene_type:complete
MKNVQNFGVQELNTKEMKEISGGFWGVVIKVLKYIGSALLADTAVNPNSHLEAFKEGVSRGASAWD